MKLKELNEKMISYVANPNGRPDDNKLFDLFRGFVGLLPNTYSNMRLISIFEKACNKWENSHDK